MKKTLLILSVTALALSSLFSGCISIHREAPATTTTRSTTTSVPGATTTTTTQAN